MFIATIAQQLCNSFIPTQDPATTPVTPTDGRFSAYAQSRTRCNNAALCTCCIWHTPFAPPKRCAAIPRPPAAGLAPLTLTWTYSIEKEQRTDPGAECTHSSIHAMLRDSCDHSATHSRFPTPAMKNFLSFRFQVLRRKPVTRRSRGRALRRGGGTCGRCRRGFGGGNSCRGRRSSCRRSRRGRRGRR